MGVKPRELPLPPLRSRGGLRGGLLLATTRCAATLLSLIIFLPIVATTSLAAKPDPAREAAYEAVKQAYEAHQWERSVLLADQFQQKYPRSDREAALLFITADAEFNLRRLDAAERNAYRIVLQFPQSGPAERARSLLGEICLLSDRWDDAERHLSWVIGFARDTLLAASARERLVEMREFLDLQRKTTDPPPAPGDSVRIALLLPLSGPSQDDAGRFLRGFLYEWKRGDLADPLIFDTEGNAVRAVRLFQQTVGENGVWGVIGGLSSDEAAGLAAASTDLKTPFLTTVCGDEGIAAIGRWAVQGRPDYGKIGAALGRYAVVNLGLHRLAILLPAEPHSRQLARGFREAVAAGDDGSSGSAEILVETSFYPGTIDLTNYLLEIKNVALRRVFDDSLRAAFDGSGTVVLDGVVHIPSGAEVEPRPTPTLDETPTAGGLTLARRFLDSLWAEEMERVRRWMELTGRDVDSAAIDVPALDGILVVIEPGTAEIVAPQIARYNLNRQLIGNEAWGDREALRKTQRYVDGMVFADPLGLGTDSLAAAFTAAMTAAGDKVITPLHLAGERTARLVRRAGGNCHRRDEFRDALASIPELPTLSGPVTLVREERVDRTVTLVLFKDGQLHRLRD